MRPPRPDDTETLALQKAFLEDLNGRRPRNDADRALAFRRPPRGRVGDRWHVYAHGYVARVEEAMGLEYAGVRRILGADAFADLIARYLAVFPPRSWDLARAGDRLPGFLELDRLAGELPFLADLATLERAVSRAFVAADAEPLSWEDLVARGPEGTSGLRLSLLPGVTLLRSAWPLHALWVCRLEDDDDAVSVPVEDEPSRVLVYRRDGRVRVDPVSELQAALVEAASCGDATLEELAELAGAADAGELVAAFRALVEREVFVLRRSTGWTGALEFPKEAFS
jgi:hypothetical protein